MIKKIRIQIALVLLVLIFFFIAFAYGSALFDMRASIENDAQEVLNIMNSGIVIGPKPMGGMGVLFNPALEDFGRQDLENDYNRQAIFCAILISQDGQDEVYFAQNGDMYTDEEMENLVSLILDTNDNSGRYEGYYYLVDQQDSLSIVSVIDKNAEWDNFRRAAFSMLFFNLIGFSITAVIVWILTGFITRPIADAMDAKKRFISDASHELKTPLTIISANAEVLKEDLGSDNAWLSNIESQTHRMQYLVQEMLQLSSLEEGHDTKPKQAFSLSQIAADTVMPFDAIAYEKGLNLTYQFDDGLNTVGDADSFRKIVGTLTDNAIKYASDNGNVEITLKHSQNNAIFSVYNTGCGIPNKERKRVFERFYRSDSSRARATGGSGLGLAIAQATSKLNHWTLKLESEEDVYTKFILTVKLAQ